MYANCERTKDQMTEANQMTELESKFPHVVNHLQIFWGSKELRTYIESLATTDRVRRDGFPVEVMSDLMFLRDLHTHIVPAPLAKSPWDVSMWFDKIDYSFGSEIVLK